MKKSLSSHESHTKDNESMLAHARDIRSRIKPGAISIISSRMGKVLSQIFIDMMSKFN